jgi:hypothetical protein
LDKTVHDHFWFLRAFSTEQPSHGSPLALRFSTDMYNQINVINYFAQNKLIVRMPIIETNLIYNNLKTSYMYELGSDKEKKYFVLIENFGEHVHAYAHVAMHWLSNKNKKKCSPNVSFC